MCTRRLLVLGLSATAGIAAGWLGPMLTPPQTALSPSQPIDSAVVSAQPYCGQVVACAMDATVTSAVDVDHRVTPGGLTDDPVQLDNSESVSITAYWSIANSIAIPVSCRCSDEVSASVTVAMSLSGTTWSATCTGCNPAGLIQGVTLCDINADNCNNYDGDYRLVVDIAQVNGMGGGICGSNPRHLNRVVYEISSIDDGDAYDAATCILGNAVSPTQSVFTATDAGAFECAYNCSQTGTAITVIFQ